MSEVRLIDANALKAKIQSKCDNDDAEFDRGYNIGLKAAVDLIDSAPTLPNPCGNPCNFTRPTGRWTDDKCSVCGKGIQDLIESREWYKNETPNYCPFCGVRIEEAENEQV